MVNFYKKLVNGVNHVTADIRNLPADLAQFLKGKFPAISIELIPALYNTKDGNWYQNVIRSVGFLDPAEMRPAVNLPADYVLNYSQEQPVSVVTLFCECDPETQQEKEPMPEETKVTPVPTVSIDEFAALKSQVAEMKVQAEKAEQDKKILQAQLLVSTQKQEAQEVEMFCQRLSADLKASPALIALVKPLLGKADNQAILEFAADNKTTMREGVKAFVEAVIKMKDALTVPIGEFSASASIPDNKPSKDLEHAAMIAEFAQAAKNEAKNPQDEREVWLLAYNKALAKYGDKLEG
jgi:hypothetical protein